MRAATTEAAGRPPIIKAQKVGCWADTLLDTITALVDRLLHLRRQDAEGSPEHRMVLRQIEGLRYSREGCNTGSSTPRAAERSTEQR